MVVTDALDPVGLLRCHRRLRGAAAGQIIALSVAGRTLSGPHCSGAFRRSDARAWLNIAGKADPIDKEGDALEFSTAAVSTSWGQPRSAQSVSQVKSSSYVSTGSRHAEIDLLFTWGGRLWLIDCKDRCPRRICRSVASVPA